jgi:hypothetical protein
MERKQWYYWVKVNTGWLIMEWCNHNVSFLLDGHRYPERYPNASIVDINEIRIISPDELADKQD